jgi:hypothetical protein
LSTIKVNNIQSRTGSAISFTSGDTITIPSGATLTNNGTANGFPGLGKIGQVVYATNTTALFTTSTSFVTTSFTGSITPSSSSSKILGILLCRPYTATSSNEMVGQISSNRSTTPWEGYLNYNNGGAIAVQSTLTFVDTPNTTGVVTYTLKIRSTNGGSVAVHPNGATDGTGGYILMEVLA